MTHTNASDLKRRNIVSARRLALLTTAAVFVMSALAAGPGGYRPTGFAALTSSASAADITLQHPVGFADIVAKVKPAVISVRVKVDESAKMMSMNENGDENVIPFPPGSPMEKFFKQFGFENMPNGMPQRHEMITGEGSGFFISADGYAVTNNHVVDHAKSVQVTTDDGTVYTAKVIGTDPKTDLALLKVDGKNDFPYVKFADHAAKVGDWVVAVGNPFGLGGTVTAGIVSARGRDIGAGPYDDYVQIDAPINKGNSGGPAFDVDGNVIGVNTAIFSPSGGSVGIGFDIPAETAKTGRDPTQREGQRHPRLARRADLTCNRGYRRQPWPEESRRRHSQRAAGRQPGGQGRNRIRRRHHLRQWHLGEGRARACPHDQHDGSKHLHQA